MIRVAATSSGLLHAHFAKLVEDYREVIRGETNVEPLSDAAEAELRKHRASLKDEIYGHFTA